MHINGIQIEVLMKQILDKAAREIKKNIGNNVVLYSKKFTNDLVTAADLVSERTIKEEILRYFPDSLIFSEESDFALDNEKFKKAGALVFIIDPLDGTKNYVSGIFDKAISVGIYKAGVPIFGAVLHLSLNDYYFVGLDDLCIYQNERVLRKCVNYVDLENAVVGSSWAYGNSPLENIKLWQKLAGKVRTLRITGSAVMDLIYTATGVFDCYIHNSLTPFDLGAGILFLKQAGLKYTNWKGEELTIFDHDIIAAPPKLFNEFYELLFNK